MFKNMKIGKRLSTAFIIIIVVFVLSSVIAVASIFSVAKSLSNFYNGPYIVTKNAFDMRSLINSAERNLLWSCTTEDSNLTSQRLDQMTSDLNDLQDRLAIVTQSFKGDQNLIKQFDSLMRESISIKEEVVELSRQNKVNESINLYEAEYAPKLSEAKLILEQILTSAETNAVKFHENGISTRDIALLLTGLFALAIVIVVLVLCVALTKSITRPVVEIENAAKQIAEGNLKVTIDYQSKDELGGLADNVRSMVGLLSEIIQDEDYLLGEMANGNFSIRTRIEEKYIGDYKGILLSMRNINRKLSSTLAQIRESADQVASGSDQVSSGAQALSQGATEQASSIQELAATVTEISEQVKENAKNAQKSSQIAQDTGDKMQESNQQMQEMILAMEDISNSSSKIGKIIKTIEDIAFQTNILALNAAVEAARAGAAGKGFAVVADEVRNLASKSAEASKDTSALIESSIKAVERGTNIANETAQSLVTAVDGARQVVENINRISEASNEQATSITQVTMGVDQISSVVQTNSATAEESAAASEELSGQAQMLNDLVSQFQLRNEDATANALPSMPAAPVQEQYSSVTVGDKY